MAYTERSRQSWGGRLKNSIGGAVLGVVFVVGACILLFWNEGRAVKRAKTLKEGAGVVVSIDSAELDTAQEGHLVHFSDLTESDETLTDPLFGQSLAAHKLNRQVEMYQWREKQESRTEKKTGGGTEKITTYNYEKTWSGSAITSSSFKEQGHDNPPFEFASQNWQASRIHVGAFELAQTFKDDLKRTSAVSLTDESLAQVSENLRQRLKVRANTFYLGNDPDSPEIGDTRVRFLVVLPEQITVVGRQEGETLAPYQTQDGSIALLSYGSHSAETMFERAHAANTLQTWVLRLVGFVLIFIAFNMIMAPLSTAADVIPFIGNLVGKGIALVAFVIALVISLAVIATGWVVYRPVVGFGLFAVAGGLGFWLIRRARSKASASPPHHEPPPHRRAPPPPPPPPPPGGKK